MKKQFLINLLILAVITILIAATPTFFKGSIKVGSTTNYTTIDDSGITFTGTGNISGITNITNSGYISTGYIKGDSGQLCGTANINSGNSSVKITYNSAFNTIPVVVATATKNYSIYVSTSTTTSCYLILTTGTAATTTTINWVAIEPN